LNTYTLQIDPNEKLDPEVEDVLIDIAEDFVESVSCLASCFPFF
jgi:transcription initiation factor TFIID subunit 12